MWPSAASPIPTAIVTWTTDEAASSQVSYGVTTTYTYSTTLDPTLVTSHSVMLTGLMPGTTYNFDVMSANSAGHLVHIAELDFHSPRAPRSDRRSATSTPAA